MAVMATDQVNTNTGNSDATANGSTSPTEGGFTPEWNQEAPQRVEARRHRVRAAAATPENNARAQPQPQQAPVSEEIDEDDEESMFLEKFPFFFKSPIV